MSQPELPFPKGIEDQDEHVTSLNMKDYISDLVHDLARSYGEKEAVLYVEVPPLEMDADTAMPVGLVVNELVNNAFKYAFIDIDRQPELKVILEAKREGEYLLTISDNGIGLDEETDELNQRSFGMKLIDLLIRKQLKGVLEMVNDNGLTYLITFKLE